jgi:hypothetical protein
MFVVGVISIILVDFFSSLNATSASEGLESGIPIFIFAVGANIGYTLGWIAELATQRVIHRSEFAPFMFIRGTVFSIALCLLPGVAAILMWFWRVIRA